MDVTWDAAFLLAPADSDEYKYGANKIREFKTAINERFIVEHDIATGLHKPGETSILYAANEADIANLANMALGALVYADASNESGEVKRLQYYDGANWVDIYIDESLITNLTIPSSPTAHISGEVIWAANNSNITISANAITVQDANSAVVEVTGLSAVIDTGDTGANGIDTGSLAANTWYALYVIYGSGEDDAGIISTNQTAPGLPANYTHWARLGWVRADANANLFPTIQKGRKVQYIKQANISLPVIKSGDHGNYVTPTYVATNIANFVPPSTAEILFAIQNSGGQIGVAPNGNYGNYTSNDKPPILVYTATHESFIQGFILESSNIYSFGSSANTIISCFGWIDS